MDGNNISNLFEELIKKQRKDCKENKKLTLQDIRRISKNLKSSIFDVSCCSLWKGYITNRNKNTKSSYINFYFRHRKVALHRLLYENYVSDIEDNQYIKYNCCNKGICCNINHMYTIEKIDTTKKKKTPKKLKNKNKQQDEKVKSKKQKKKLIVDFD